MTHQQPQDNFKPKSNAANDTQFKVTHHIAKQVRHSYDFFKEYLKNNQTNEEVVMHDDWVQEPNLENREIEDNGEL